MPENFLGRIYPFIISNEKQISKASHYIYQFFSPGVNPKTQAPLISMVKVSERIRDVIPGGKNVDIITLCSRVEDKDNPGKYKVKLLPQDYLMDLLTKKDDITVDFTINSGGEKEFPVFEANDELGTSLQKMIIVLLRDTIRWKNYRFFPGRQVDILWTKDEYVLFDIIKTEETIEFKPRAVYKNTDVGMITALDVDLSKIDCSELVWKKDEYKASDVNRAIKKLEKNSFERKSFVVEG